MSSTSSSSERSASTEKSSTESLARRYRLLFTLPSTVRLLLYAAFTSSLLVTVITSALNPVALSGSFLAIVLASTLVAALLRLVDVDTIATFRRTTAILFAGGVLWVISVAVGSAASHLVGSGQPLANAVVFGAFVAAGFEFIVIDGAFEGNSFLSAALAVLHPTLVLGALWLAGVLASPNVYSLPLGAAAFIVLALFPLMLKQRSTSRGQNTVQLFQAFLKTWTMGRPAKLETIIADHSETIEVSTKILKFSQNGKDFFVILPGVHPGPFHPVGSYNLTGLIFQEFGGSVLTLHRPGGHERNITTNQETKTYVEGIHEYALGIPTSDAPKAHGPVTSRIGTATVTATTIQRDTLLTISFAPLGSEDLETATEDELARLGRQQGLDVSVVDAHNSIEPKPELVDTGSPGWAALLSGVSKSGAGDFVVGYANSSETGFGTRQDITVGGIGVLVLKTGGTKWVLVLADANNAEPTLRGVVAEALESAGYRLLELCTSDSHNLAARGMTVTRGYFAIGEITPPKEIAELLTRLARLSESRIGPCEYGSGTLVSKVRVFGADILDEFEELTRSSSEFAKRYFKIASVSILLLMVASALI